MLILIKVLTWLASPLGLFFLLVLAGLVIRPWRFRLIGLGCGMLWAFASYPVADLMTRPLEDRARALEEKHKAEFALAGIQPAAILVLGGGMSAAIPPDRPYPDMGEAADRVWHGARLYHSGAAPYVLVSGGKVPGLEEKALQTEAEAMRALLIDLGVPSAAILMEGDSRTTRENASRSLVLLQKRLKQDLNQGPGLPILLVTSASHMARSVSNFESAGFLVGARPTDFRAVADDRPLWRSLLPSAIALERSEAVIKEWLACLVNY